MATEATPIDEFFLRLAQAGSGDALAEELGVTKQLISHIKQGRRSVSADLAYKLGFKRTWKWERI